MSEHQTCSQDRFISHQEAQLFETLPDTVHRHKRQVSIDLELSLKQIYNNRELSEEDSSTLLRSRLSIMNNQNNSNQDNDNDQDNDNQQSSSQNLILTECNAVIYQRELDVKLAKLEIRKLKLLTAHE